MYSFVFVIDYKSSTDSMVGFATVCVYCCFCLLYMYWFAVKAVSVYFSEPVIDGCVTSIISCFLYNSVQVLCPILYVGFGGVCAPGDFIQFVFQSFVCISRGSMFSIISRLIWGVVLVRLVVRSQASLFKLFNFCCSILVLILFPHARQA